MNETLDKILKYLDSENSYVRYDLICKNYDISDSDSKYILSKLDNEGFIDIIDTKDYVDIKISDEGRIFINETSFSKEAKLEKTNIKSSKRQKLFNALFKILTIILSILTVYFGYNSITKDQLISQKIDEIKRLKRELSSVDNVIKELHFFSNMTTKDTFILHMSGESILESDIEFVIRSILGDTIFYHKFKSQDLIGYGLIDIESPTSKQKENYLLKRFYDFFNDSNFISPAIPKDEEIDDEFFDTKYFNIIQNQTDAISFYYLLGEEYMRRIVYLQKKKIVVEFWSCC